MPMCGFNKKMIEGLKAFNEGLVEHGLNYRSKLNNETIEQGIKREISDMTRLLQELHNIDDSAKRVITEGITKYCMGFYLLARKNDLEKYPELIEKISRYFFEMDDKYYSELEGNTDDMQRLVEHLNNIEIDLKPDTGSIRKQIEWTGTE